MSKKTRPSEDVQPLVKSLTGNIKLQRTAMSLAARSVKRPLKRPLESELEDHPGYAKHDPAGHHSGNSRNGDSSKTVKGDHGNVDIDVPRERNGSFEPQIVRRGQARLTGFDDQILALYAKGMTTRDIVAMFKELNDAEVSATLVSQVTERVMEQRWPGSHGH